jgi:hypothetical protein
MRYAKFVGGTGERVGGRGYSGVCVGDPDIVVCFVLLLSNCYVDSEYLYYLSI